jgi:hypothetical protein
MKTTEMLSKIKALLNANVNLAEMKLDNGTVLEAESFEAGSSVFIKTEDEKVALPIGEYKLEDGRSLVVEEEGVIASIGEAVEEAPSEEVEVEAEEEVIETEVPAEVAPEVEAIVEAVVEVIAPAIEEVKEELRKLKAKFEDKKPEEKKEEKKEEMSRTFKHSPERNKSKKQEIKFSQNKPETTLDRVLKQLNK